MTKHRKFRQPQPDVQSRPLHQAVRRWAAVAASGAVVMAQTLPAYGQVTPELVNPSNPSAGTTTATLVDPGTGNITTDTIANSGGQSVGYNVFSQFDIAGGQTYNLIQPSGSDALVNVVRGSAGPSTIAGRLNVTHADGITSNVFIVDAQGFVVSGTGIIDAGNLTLSTATPGFSDDLVSGIATNGGVAQLFAGTEPLAGSSITVDAGGQINATGLELRAGLNLILDGTITVNDPGAAGGAPGVAVNTDGRPQATGVSVSNGVIRFGAGSSTQVSGTVTARNGTSGGAIVSTSGDLQMKTGAVVSAAGTTGDAGAIILFTDGSAVLERGVRLDTTSVAGAGGFALVKAMGAVATAATGTGVVTLAGGAAVIEGAAVTVDHDIVTAGGDLSVIGASAVAIGAGATIATDADSAGDLIVTAPAITVGSNADLGADGATAGGLVALVASARAGGGIWSISDVSAAAGVVVADAVISGGAVVITSAADATNVLRETDIAAAEAQNDIRSLDDAFAAAETRVRAAVTQQLLKLDARSPLTSEKLAASSEVRVTGAVITADGSWGNPAGLLAIPGAADNGVLGRNGAALTGYALPGTGPLARVVMLPAQFDAAAADVFVQAYAATTIDIDVGDKALSASIARVERAAAVVLDAADITGATGVSITSAAHDTIAITTAARDVDGTAIGVTYATSDTRNQLLVNGGTMDAPDVALLALTGKTYDITNAVRSATVAKGAAAITVALSASQTEAAVNTDVTAGRLTVAAETLYFDLSSTTNATLGVDTDLAQTTQTTQSAAARRGEDFGDTVNAEASGDGSDEPASEADAGGAGAKYGLAVDYARVDDTTRAVIGEAATDMGLTAGLIMTTDATLRLTGALNLTATQRFARADEGGGSLLRNVHAVLGALPAGSTGNFGAVSVMAMTGNVSAILGTTADVEAGSATIAALTSYRDDADGAATRAAITDFIADVADTKARTVGQVVEVAQMPTPSTLLDPTTYLTSSVGVRTLVQDGASQAQARGAGVAYATLGNVTTAVIRDGATLTTTGAADVTARTEGVFFHDSPNGVAAAEVTGQTPGVAGNVIGGSLIFGRTNAETAALIAGAATVDTGDLSVLADTALIQIARTEGGGAGASKAINAAIAANAVTTKTHARVGELVQIDAADVTIAAADASIIIAVGGSETESASRAAGAGLAFNIINRDTVADLGTGDATLGVALAARVNADSLSVTAANSGVALAAGIASTKTSGSVTATTGTNNAGDTNAPTHLMQGNERAAVNSRSSTTTRANQSGGTQRSGWAISGAAALNLMTRDDVTARLATNATVALTGDLTVQAASRASTLAIGGAVFRGQAPASKATGLAGAFALNFDTGGRNTIAYLTGATVVAGATTIAAADTSDNIAVAAGGGGQTKPGAAIAGSVALVNETGTTQTLVAGVTLASTGDVAITAANSARLEALGGAAGANLTVKGAGLGAGVAVINTARDAQVVIADGVALRGAHVTTTAVAAQNIQSIGASIGAGTTGVSGSVAANTLTGDTRVLIGTSGGTGAVITATSATLSATDNNSVWTRSGAIGVGKTTAVGAGLSVNTVVTRTELAVLGSTITGPATINLATYGASSINARAAAGAASGGTTASIGATVNTVRADTLTRFDASSLNTGSASLTASNGRVITSRAGGAAVTSSSAAGFALAANTLSGNDTRVSLNGAQITAAGSITATATTTSQIDSKAAAISFGNNNAGSASVAVGVIATQTRVQAAGATLTAGDAITLLADKGSSVDVLAGSVALSGTGTAVGGAVAVTVLRDTVTADLATDAAVTAGSLAVTARSRTSVTARAVAGAATASHAVNAAIVFTQTGVKSLSAPSVTGSAGEPAPDASADADVAATAALGDVTAQTGVSYALDQDDLTRARVELGGGAVNVGAVTILSEDNATIDTNAGGLTLAGSNGGGVAVNTALLFGKVEAALDVAEGQSALLAAPVSVRAAQNGILTLDARAGSAARTYAGTGSVVVAVLDRQVDARVSAFDGTDAGTDIAATTLRTHGAAVTIDATQAGSLRTRAGAATGGASGAIGGAVIVSYIADDATAAFADLTLDQRIAIPTANPLAGAGVFTATSANALNLNQSSQSFGFSANLAFAGSFGVAAISTDTTTRITRARVDAGSAVIASQLNNTLTTQALSLAAGKVAGAFAVISNTSDGRVLTDIDGADIRTDTTLIARADAAVTVNAAAASGGAAAATSLSGSALSNDIGNRAETILRDSGSVAAPRLLSRGSVAVLSTAQATYDLGGGLTIGASASNSFGGTVVVTQSRNQALTTLRDNAAVDGLGYATLSLTDWKFNTATLDPAGSGQGKRTPIGTIRGALVSSYANSDLDLRSVTAGVAGGFTGAATLAYNTTGDTALTSIGQNTEAAVNGLQGDLSGASAVFFTALGAGGAHVAQDSQIAALTASTADVLVGSGAVSGTAAVGASSVISLVTSRAEVAVNVGYVDAANRVMVDAASLTDIAPTTVGLSGSTAALAASVTYSEVASRALVSLLGADLRSGGDMSVLATAVNDVDPLTGNIAAGKAAGAGSFAVTKIASAANVSAAPVDATRFVVTEVVNPTTGGVDQITRTLAPVVVDTALAAGGNVDVHATTQNALTGTVIAGVVGGAGLGFAANIAFVEGTTGVVLGGGQTITATDVTLTTQEQTHLTGNVGMGAAAAGAIGGALDYLKFAGRSNVVIGAGAEVIARRDIAITSDAARSITSNTGVASIAGSSATAALSFIDVGGLSDALGAEASAMLGQVETSFRGSGKDDASLTDAQRAQQQADRGGETDRLVDRSGAGAVRDAALARRFSNADYDGIRADAVGVAISDGASLRAGNIIAGATAADVATITPGAISVTGQIRSAISQNVGVVGLSSAGISASVGKVSLSSGVSVATGTNTELRADGAVTLTARTGNLGSGNAIDSTVLNLAAGGATANAGLAFVDNGAVARVTLDGSTTIAGLSQDFAGAVTLSAARAERATGKTINGALSATGAIGVSRAQVESSGTSLVSVVGDSATARATIVAQSITVRAQDTTSVASEAVGASGGLLFAGNGVETVGRNIGQSQVNLTDATLTGYAVTVDNSSSANVVADSFGVTVGSVAVGVTLSTAEFGSSLTTNISDTQITANSVVIATTVTAPLDGTGNPMANAKARSFAATGGLAAGAGTTAAAYTAYSVRTNVSGTTDIFGQDLVQLGSAAQGVRADAMATGVIVGAVAVGVVTSEAGQIGNRQASVQTHVHDGRVQSFGDVEIFADNNQDVTVDTVAGSGGLATGSGSIVRTRVNARTLVSTGQGGLAHLIAGDLDDPEQTDGTLIIRAAQQTTLASTLNNTSAAAIGFSGGRVDATLIFDTDTDIGGGTLAQANRMDIAANHTVSRPADGFNIRSASGGVFDGASIASGASVTADTDVLLDGGAYLQQLGDLDFYQSIVIGVTTDTELVDRIKLDAGGGLALPLGKSEIQVNRNVANVTFGNVRIDAIGPITVYTGSFADVRTEAFSTSYGLAGSASADTVATYQAENIITVGGQAHLVSLYDISLRAGYGRGGLQNLAVNAESRVYNKTVIPVTRPATARAVANTHAQVIVDAGARVYAYEDIMVDAAAGGRQVRGYGLAKDFYLEILAAVANAAGEIFGLDPIVFDIRRGTSIDDSDNGITVNGELRAGAFNRRSLTLDANLNDISGSAGTRAEVFFDVARNVPSSADISARLDAVRVRLADPNLPPHPAAGSSDPPSIGRTVLEAIEADLISQLAAANGPPPLSNDIITVRPFYAAEGSVTMLADYIEGAGDISAAGDVVVDIISESGANLQIAGIAVSRNQGGAITFNNRLIESNADLAAVSDGGAGSSGITLTFDDGTGNNDIFITTNVATVVGGRDGSIDIIGDVTNDRGDITISSNDGSVSIRASVAGVNLNVNAAQDINAVYEGFFRAGGDPARGYQDIFDAAARGMARSILAVSGSTRPVELTFAPRASNSGITAGRNINFIATTVNINSTIKAGTGTYDVIINAGIDAEIAALRQRGGSGRQILYDNAAFATPGTVKSSNIDGTTNANIYYNFDTDQIEVDDMLVRGGRVSITGNIISTGTGRIEALDGQGALNLISYGNTDVVLKGIDLGGSADGAGLAGLVRITDTGKFNSAGRALVTEYRRLDGKVTIVTNETTRTEVSDLFGTVAVPTFVVQAPIAGRSATYVPVQNRDYVVRETTQYNATFSRRYDYYVEGDWTFISEKNSAIPVFIRREAIAGTTYLQDAPSVENSIGPNDYSYRFESVANPDDPLVPLLASFISARSKFDLTFRSNVFESHSGGVHLIGRSDGFNYTETEVETHRLKADYPVEIFFSGSDTAQFNITTQGNVILSESIFNAAGPASITSHDGSILTAGNDVTLTSQDLNLSAVNGSITGLGGAFQIDLLDTEAGDNGRLNAIAGTAINIFETVGDLHIGTVATGGRDGAGQTVRTGQITLAAQGGILHETRAADTTGATAIAGTDITLTSLQGGIGAGDAAPLLLNTEADGVLNITARDDINIIETIGDLALGVVTSEGGSVTIDVPTGSLLDRNDIQERDVRTRAQLDTLWDTDLGLRSGFQIAIDRREEQLANLKNQRRADYEVYWLARDTAGGAAQTYVMSQQERDYLATTDREGNPSTRLIDARQTAMDTLYTQWNADGAFDAAYEYVIDGPEEDDLLDGYLWTTQELTRSIQDGTIARIGDTVLDVEAANIIAANNITIRALGVGELLDPYQVASTGVLTDRDYEVLALAGPGDVTVTGNVTLIRQDENVNFALGVTQDGTSRGVLRVIAQDRDIYLGAETSARLATIDGTRQVQVQISGLLTDARDAAFAVNGQIITLEAGLDGAIGTAATPVTVNVAADGNLTARAGGDVYIAAPTSDLPLQTIFAGGTASLQTPGAITDSLGTATPRIVADGIILAAATIGTDAAPLGIAQADGALGNAGITTTSGAGFVTGYGDLSLRQLTVATGGRLDLVENGQLILTGADTIRFGAVDSFAINTGNGLTSVGSTGTDITGGVLTVTTDARWGGATAPVTTALSAFNFAPQTAGRDVSLWLKEADDLATALIDLGSSTATIADLTIGGAFTGAVQSGGDVRVRAASATLTRVTADDLGVTTVQALHVDDLQTTGDAILDAGTSLTAASARGRGLTLSAGTTAVLTDALATAALTARAGTTLTIGRAQAATDMALNAQIINATTLTAADLVATASATLTAGNLQVTGLAALTAGTDLTVGMAAGRILRLDAGATGVLTDVIATEALAASAGTTLTIGQAQAGTDMVLNAGIIAATGLSAADLVAQAAATLGVDSVVVTGTAMLTAGTALTVANATGHMLDFDAGRDATLTTVTATGDLAAKAGGVLRMTRADAGADMTLRAGVLDAQRLGAADLVADAVRRLTVADVQATQTAALTAGTDLSVTKAMAGMLTVQAGALATLDSVTATGALSANAGTVLAIGQAQAGLDMTLAAQTMTAKTLVAGDLVATATETLTATTVTVTDRATLTAGTDLTLTLTSGTTLTFGAGGDAALRDVVASGAVVADAGGRLAIETASAGTDMALAADRIVATSLTATDLTGSATKTVVASDVRVSNAAEVAAGTDLTVVSSAGRALSLAAGGNAVLNTVAAGDTLTADAAGLLTIGQAFAGSVMNLSGQKIDSTLLTATDLIATAGTDLTIGMGTSEAANLLAGEALMATLDTAFVNAAATAGALDLTLKGRDTRIGTVQTGNGQTGTGQVGNGPLWLRAENAAVTAELIATEAGTLTALFKGDLTQTDTGAITSQSGDVTVSVDGDFAANRVATDGSALRVTTGGAIRAVDPMREVITANAPGAVTTLRLGTSAEDGETGLRINVDQLDAVVARGDLHLLDSDGLRALSVIAQSGTVDLSSRGRLDVGSVTGKTVTLTSARDLTADGAAIAADAINLFAFGGNITGATGVFDVDTATGAVLVLHATGDVNLRERSGNLRVAIANAVTGDLAIAAADPAGLLDIGAIGTGGTLRITSNGDLALNTVGGGRVDLVDEDGLRLIDRSDPRYGLTDLATPDAVILTAGGEDSTLSLRLGQVGTSAMLFADTVTATLFDTTPGDGLTLTVAAPEGGFAKADIGTVASGQNVLITDPFGQTDVVVDLATLIDGGVMRVADSRISGGDILHRGDVLSVASTQVSGDVWLRQQDNDVLATLVFKALDPQAEVQILALDSRADAAIPPGSVEFVLAAGGAFVTSNKLVLTRDIDVLVLNAAPGTLTGVLLDQLQILTTGPAFRPDQIGRTQRLQDLLLPEAYRARDKDDQFWLPFVLSAAETAQ